MKVFRRALEEATVAGPPARERTWVYVPYDQLTHAVGPLAGLDPERAGIVLVESPAKAARRPYHKAKLFLLLANQRRFALEQAERGVLVDYRVTEGGDGYAEELERAAREHGTLAVMEPAERELRVELEPLVRAGKLRVEPHAGWLTTPEDFIDGTGELPPWRMDRFYRHVRKQTGILMGAGGKFEGGKLSFDAENRRAWSGDPPAPRVPHFRHGEIEDEVEALVRDRFARHPGELRPETIPTRHEHALRVWRWAREECLPHFGPFEDAMAEGEASLFHTRISPLLNLLRLLPRTVVEDVAALDAPIASREGFVRQVLGWREFVRHVHRATDGFRELPDGTPRESAPRADAAFEHWSGEPWARPGSDSAEPGAAPRTLDAPLDLPSAWWGTASGLHCLDTCVARVLEDGYGHHIERLMVLSNLGTLLGVSPRQLTDWFWCAYVDAYDWVVEPNVLGMGTYAVGDVMTTKPYVSGAPYIDRMSDFCRSCQFDPKRTCPITRLYWAFLARNAETLNGNQRIAMPLRSLAKRSPAEREEDERVRNAVVEALAAGVPYRSG